MNSPSHHRHAVALGLGIFLLCVCVPPANSQRLRFDHLTTSDGLSHDIVTSIAQDSHGIMWFGTEVGLNRFDGYSMRTYLPDPSDSTSLPETSIDALLVDRRGRLWVSSSGVNLYQERIDGFRRFRYDAHDPSSLPDNHVPALCQDSSGAIWAGTDLGLAVLDERSGSWRRFVHDPQNTSSLRANVVRALLAEQGGTLWVGTDQGLDRYDPGTGVFRHVDLGNASREPIAVNSIFRDPNGVLWIGTRGAGLIRFDPKSGRTRQFLPNYKDRNSLGSGLVFQIALAGGRLWIGHFGGLDVFDESTEFFEHYTRASDEPDPLIGDRVYAVYPDRSGTIWLGTYHGGVERYDPDRKKFGLIRPNRGTEPGVPDENVLSVMEDRRGRLWVGTPLGLAVSRPFSHAQSSVRFSPLNTPLSDRFGALSIMEDKRGTIWIGRDDDGGLQHVDQRGRRIGQYPYPGVQAMLEDRSGYLWFGTRSDGLIRFSPATRRSTWFRSRLEHPDSLHGAGVWSLFEDRHGIIWVGTVGTHEGLNRFNPTTTTFEHFSYLAEDPAGFPGGSIRAIVEDDRGRLWLGSWGGGLTRFDPATHQTRTLTRQDGLPSNYVKAILRDDHGFFWISTERGIIKFDLLRESFRTYSTEDGLQGDRFYSGSAYRGKSGRMYFGGEHGLNYFYPDEIKDRSKPLRVVLTSFKVYDKPIDLPDGISQLSEIQLSYRQDFLSFEFVALDFSSPARTRYAYKLEGLDTNWISAADRRYAVFTHLDPGTYTFRVKAANADGVWSTEETSIRMIIDPPFWATAWFRLMAIVLAIGGLYLAIRMRISRILAVERLRQRIAQDLHDDIGTNLSTIALASGSLKGQRGLRKEVRATLNRISTVTVRTADQMRDIVWVLKTGNDSLDHLVAKMREVTAHLLGTTRVRFEAPAEALLDRVDLDFKRNVFLFFKECVNNVARHAKATEVVIRIGYANGMFKLEVQDNGRGYGEITDQTGSGIQNLRARAGLLGGGVEIDTEPGKGTRVALTVKTTQMRHGFLGKGSVG